jgi:hypothetical protein
MILLSLNVILSLLFGNCENIYLRVLRHSRITEIYSLCRNISTQFPNKEQGGCVGIELNNLVIVLTI